MGKVNKDWVKEQFTQIKVKVGVGKAVLRMLETWEEIDLKEQDAKQALELLAKLGMNEYVVPPKKEDVWADTQPGFVKVADIVRVRPDAYLEPELASLHNGKRGVIVAIRSGDVIVKYDEKPLGLDSMDPRHSPYKLQKKVN
jgi:hypothetical protein